MTTELSHMTYVELATNLNKKKQEFEIATMEGKPHYEINEMYKQLKAFQQEMNLRIIANRK